MTQQELNRLKEAAEKIGRWAVYLLTETEYWTPEALEELTEEKLQEFQTRQAQWLMENERKYPDSGATELLREEITAMVKSRDGCLTEDEASEMERQRLDGMDIEDLPQRLREFRKRQEVEEKEYVMECKLMDDRPLTQEETDYIHRLPKDHLLQKLLAIDEKFREEEEES